MKLRAKILSGFVILSLVLLLAVVWAVHQMSTLGASAQKILDENYRSINAAEVMLGALERQDSAILLLVLGEWEQGRSILQAGDESFRAELEIAKGNVTLPGEGSLVESVDAGYAEFRKLWIRPIVGTDKEGNLDWYSKQVHPAFLQVKGRVRQLMNINDTAMYQAATDLKNQADRAVMPGVVAGVATLVLSLVFSYFVNYYMVSPILRITRGADEFLRNNKPFSVTIETRDEIARLGSVIHALCLEVSAARKKER